MKRSVKILFSLLFLFLIGRSLHTQNPWEYLRDIRPGWTALSMGVSLAMVLVSCWKWKVLLELELAPVPFLRLLRFYFIGYYYSVLLPSNVGGDVMRSYLTGRETGSHSRAAVSVFLERISGLFVLLLLASTTPLLVPGLIRNPAVLIPVLTSFVLLLALIVGLVLPAPHRWMPRLFARCLSGWDPLQPRGRVAKLAAKFVHALDKIHARLLSALRELDDSASGKPAVLMLSTIFYLLTWINVWVSFQAFGVQVSFASVMAVVPVCMMIASLPIAPFAGLGLTEGAYIFFFGLAGVPRTATLAMALLLRLKLLGLGFSGMVCQIPGTRRPEPT